MPNALPTWGKFVTHYDSTGQAAMMATSFSPDNAAVSLLFDRMVISLQGDDPYKLAGSIGLAGHFPIALPDEYPLHGFVLIARGIVLKSADCGAVLTLSMGESTRTLEWPTTGKIIDVGAKPQQPHNVIQEFRFDTECFSGAAHLAMGKPPKFLPLAPLTLAFGMHARRRSIEETVEVHFESVDLTLL